jgi:uncharacterized membrane protein YqjE
MSFATRIRQVISMLVAMLHTRLELISIELEEGLIRLYVYFVYGLIGLFCAGVAISLSIFLVILLFWDEHRIAVLFCLISLFSAISILITIWLKAQILNSPGLLEHSIAELKKDVEFIHGRSTDAHQETQ